MLGVYVNLHVIHFLFFLKHVGELHIFILRRKRGTRTPEWYTNDNGLITYEQIQHDPCLAKGRSYS
jgi:hypothetical protein